MRSLLPLLLIVLPLASEADTVTIAPSADTGLFELLDSRNFGAQDELVSGVLGSMGSGNRCRLLMEFDISAAVPSGSTITAASLTMDVLKAAPSPASANFQLLRVLVPWVEGNKQGGNPGGAAASTGETSWRHRIHDTVDWSSPGGQLEVDFAEDPSASALVTGRPSGAPLTNVFVFNSDGVSDLQSMLNSPSGNHGWAMIAQNETALRSARRWGSREHATSAPELEITFTPPPPPDTPIIESVSLDPITGELTVTVDAVAGITYTLETRPDLLAGAWSAAGSVAATSNGTVSLDTTPAGNPKRLFFRISATHS